MSKELAKAESRELAPAFDYTEHAGEGFEEVADEIQIPFLALLQDDSKVVKNGDQPTGTLFNTVTEQNLDTEITFVPAYAEKVFVEWVPRKKGGGFVGRYHPSAPEVKRAISESKEFGKYKLPNGNDLAETIYVYGALCPEAGDLEPIVLAFTSSKIKVFKKWNTTVGPVRVTTSSGDKVKPPMFSHLVKVGVFADRSGDDDYYNLTMSPANGSVKESMLPTDDERFQAALSFGQLVKQGLMKAAEGSLEQAAEEPKNY